MTDYILNLEDFAIYLSKLDADDNYKWIANFLLKGYTSPLLSISLEQSRGSIIHQLYNLCDTEGQEKIINSTILLYKRIPSQQFVTRGFLEIMETISRLNITELFFDLYRLGFEGFLRNKRLDEQDVSIDFHAYLLKTIFGLTLEKKIVKLIIKLIRRYISDSRYTLECFTTLYQIAGCFDESIKYTPMLLKQINSKERDYAGVLQRFIESMDEENVNKYVMKIASMISKDEELISAFQNVLFKSKIYIYDRRYDEKPIATLLRIRNVDKIILPGRKKYIDPIYRKQMNNEMGYFMRKAKKGEAKQLVQDILNEIDKVRKN
jgi:hypothetical protein